MPKSARKMRLIVTYDCPRRCEGCCNKDYPKDDVKVYTGLDGFDELIITGGEPMLKVLQVNALLFNAKRKGLRTILYTAEPERLREVIHRVPMFLDFLDGLTLTLHDEKGYTEFAGLQEELLKHKDKKTHLRLHVFEEVAVPADTTGWDLRAGYKWIKNCPLPEGEELYRLE